jgi:hypothetical protein
MTPEELVTERPKTHGVFLENAAFTQAAMNLMMRQRNWSRLRPTMREALHMFMHKAARILTGDPDEPDHWDDIGGYAKLVSQELRGEATPLVEKHRAVGTVDVIKYIVKDGSPSIPPFPSILVTDPITRAGFFLADRDVLERELWDELPRLALVINTHEWNSLPAYYRPLYSPQEDGNGAFEMIGRYKPNWGRE